METITKSISNFYCHPVASLFARAIRRTFADASIDLSHQPSQEPSQEPSKRLIFDPSEDSLLPTCCKHHCRIHLMNHITKRPCRYCHAILQYQIHQHPIITTTLTGTIARTIHIPISGLVQNIGRCTAVKFLHLLTTVPRTITIVLITSITNPS